MALFILESKNGRVLHDFSFHMLEATSWINWLNMENLHECALSDVENSFTKRFGDSGIPVGSIEFVLDYYKRNYGITGIMPINIPKELQTDRFLKRKLYRDREEVPEGEKVFVKSLREFKGFTDIVDKKDIPEGEYLISEVVELESEWRGFIMDGELLDMRSYAGNFKVQPDYNIVDEMIESYESSPRAYTLDLGVTSCGDTVIIEAHEFFSCGLYGFHDYRKLIRMNIAQHLEMIKRGKK